MIWVLFTVVAVATYFDLKSHRIPNWLTYPALLLTIFKLDSFILLVLLFALLIAIIFGKFIGSGDIKLSAVIATWSHIYGFAQEWIIYALIAGGVIGLIYRRKSLPFAPYLAIGVVIANVARDYIII